MREEERGNSGEEEEGRENRWVNNGGKMEEWRKRRGIERVNIIIIFSSVT